MAVVLTRVMRKEVAKGIVLEKYHYEAAAGSTSVVVTPDTVDAEGYGVITNILGFNATDNDTPNGVSGVYDNDYLSATVTLTFTANDAGAITLYGLVS